MASDNIKAMQKKVQSPVKKPAANKASNSFKGAARVKKMITTRKPKGDK